MVENALKLEKKARREQQAALRLEKMEAARLAEIDLQRMQMEFKSAEEEFIRLVQLLNVLSADSVYRPIVEGELVRRVGLLPESTKAKEDNIG